MTRPLFLLDPLPDDDVVVLDGAEGRHAATVRRIDVGELIALSDGRGGRRLGVVTAVGRAELSVRCDPFEHVPAPDPRLVVVQAVAKGDRGELAVELMTELGVDEIVPWDAARSVVVWRAERGAKSLERWRSTAREAGKQSRRPWLPQVSALAATGAVCARIAQADGAFVLHEQASLPLAAASLPGSGEIVLVVGPEGGMDAEEVARFVAAGAQAVRLGEPVLRTSTAGAAGLAALSVRLSRWS